MRTYSFREMIFGIPDYDQELKGFFEAARQHKLVVKRCLCCGRMRWPPGPACPWCSSLEWEWTPVAGKGTICSYEIVVHSVLPGFRDWVPFPIVLVELDEQNDTRTSDECIRIMTNLVDGELNPERESKVAIGKRVEVVFQDSVEGFSLPQFRLSSESPHGRVWQFKEE